MVKTNYFIDLFGQNFYTVEELEDILIKGKVAVDLHYMLCYKEDDKITCCDSNIKYSIKGISTVEESGNPSLDIGILLQRKRA